MRRLISLLLSSIALVVLLAGCNGDSGSLNPIVRLDYPEGTTLPAWNDVTPLLIEGNATTSDSARNPVTGYSWTQSPANAGVFNSTSTFSTAWLSNPVPPGETRNVTLYLTVTTALGGKTVVPINLVVSHYGLVDPIIVFNAVPALVGDTQVLDLTPTVGIQPGDFVVSYEWTQTPANSGQFSATNTRETTWRSYEVLVNKEVTLSLTARTQMGGVSTESVTFTVTP